MKKRLLMLMASAVVFTSLSIHAMETTPAGKNELNPAYFTADYTAEKVHTHANHPIEPGTTYTLSVPTDFAGHIELILGGSKKIDQSARTEGNGCRIVNSTITACTFESSSNDSFSLSFSGSHAVQWYDHYGFHDYQLEKGSHYTGYEAYEARSETPPVFSGSGTIILSYEDNLPISTIIGENITAEDEIDGDLSDEIVITSDGYTGNETKVGNYDVRLEVSDSSGNTAYFDLEIIIRDEIPPVIIGIDHYETNVDAPDALAAIIDANFTFHDDHDGPIETYTILEDDYSMNKDVLGAHQVIIGIEDSSGNKSQHAFDILIYDDVPPIITGENDKTLYLSDPFTLDALLATYSVSDNHTPSSAMVIEIESNNAPENLDRTGTYTIVLKAYDESGNKGTKTVSLSIKDDIAPVLSGTVHHEISYTEPFDTAAFIKTLDVDDNHDPLTHEDVVLETSDYVSDVPGHYQKTFAVSDESGNKTTFTIQISVIDDVPPYFILSDAIIVQLGTTLNKSDVFNHLLKDDVIRDFGPIAMVVLSDTYTENKDRTGTYEYVVELSNGSGETLTRTALVEVSEIGAANDSTVPWLPLVTSFILLTAVVYFRKRH